MNICMALCKIQCDFTNTLFNPLCVKNYYYLHLRYKETNSAVLSKMYR